MPKPRRRTKTLPQAGLAAGGSENKAYALNNCARLASGRFLSSALHTCTLLRSRTCSTLLCRFSRCFLGRLFAGGNTLPTSSFRDPTLGPLSHFLVGFCGHVC